LHVRSDRGADTSYFFDAPLTPNTEYVLSAWIRTRNVRGALGALLNVHGTSIQTPAVSGDSDWKHVEIQFNSGDRRVASVNVLYGGYGQSRGEAWFDDVQLSEVRFPEEKAVVGDAKRGEQIFFKHAAVACVMCHTLKGQ